MDKTPILDFMKAMRAEFGQFEFRATNGQHVITSQGWPSDLKHPANRLDSEFTEPCKNQPERGTMKPDFEQSQCTGKVGFDSYVMAYQTLRHNEKNRTVYHCEVCKKFHVGTHKPKKAESPKRWKQRHGGYVDWEAA